MSRREAGHQRVALPEIDCGTPVKLADRPGLPEQYHQFEPESALAITPMNAAQARPVSARFFNGNGQRCDEGNPLSLAIDRIEKARSVV